MFFLLSFSSSSHCIIVFKAVRSTLISCVDNSKFTHSNPIVDCGLPK